MAMLSLSTLTPRQKAWQTAGDVAKTLYFPITKPIGAMYEYKKTTAVALIAIAVLVLCAIYVQTKPMENLRSSLSEAYQATVSFLKNPIHVRLVAILSATIFVFIGRELVHNTKLADNNKAWEKYFGHFETFEITDNQDPADGKWERIFTTVLDGLYYKKGESFSLRSDLQQEKKGESLPKRPEDLPRTIKTRVGETAGNIAKTLYFPITKSASIMYKYKKTTAVALVAIVTLVLCTIYVQTKPMDSFRNALSGVSQTIGDFLKNPVHARLVASIGGIVYLLIGRKLLHEKKFADNNNYWKDFHLHYTIFYVNDTATERQLTTVWKGGPYYQIGQKPLVIPFATGIIPPARTFQELAKI